MSPSRLPWRRGVRARLVTAAAGLLAVALVLGAVAVVAVFNRSLLRDTDRQTATLVDLAAGGRLPRVLPVPAGSSLLAQVLDAGNTVLAASPSASPVQALTGRDGSAAGDVDSEGGGYVGAPLRVRVTTTATPAGPVRVVVAAPLTDVRRSLEALALVLLLVVPLLVVLGTTAAWWLTGRALRPVERLRLAAEGIAADPLQGGRLPVPAGEDEVARLAATLDALLAAVRGLLDRERGFVADAAHELRSPVAGLRVQIEVAAAHPATVDLPALLADLAAETDRLQVLTDGLLALARADTGPAVRQPVHLRELAGATGDDVVVQGDPAALAGLVANLVANARRHASTVRLTTRHEDGLAVLDVDDDGPGIAAADRERVFRRWVRLDDAREADAGGAGLGLALVLAVATAHGGTVEVGDSPLGGARLRLRLPTG